MDNNCADCTSGSGATCTTCKSGYYVNETSCAGIDNMNIYVHWKLRLQKGNNFVSLRNFISLFSL